MTLFDADTGLPISTSDHSGSNNNVSNRGSAHNNDRDIQRRQREYERYRARMLAMEAANYKRRLAAKLEQYKNQASSSSSLSRSKSSSSIMSGSMRGSLHSAVRPSSPLPRISEHANDCSQSIQSDDDVTSVSQQHQYHQANDVNIASELVPSSDASTASSTSSTNTVYKPHSSRDITRSQSIRSTQSMRSIQSMRSVQSMRSTQSIKSTQSIRTTQSMRSAHSTNNNVNNTAGYMYNNNNTDNTRFASIHGTNQADMTESTASCISMDDSDDIGSFYDDENYREDSEYGDSSSWLSVQTDAAVDLNEPSKSKARQIRNQRILRKMQSKQSTFSFRNLFHFISNRSLSSNHKSSKASQNIDDSESSTYEHRRQLDRRTSSTSDDRCRVLRVVICFWVGILITYTCLLIFVFRKSSSTPAYVPYTIPTPPPTPRPTSNPTPKQQDQSILEERVLSPTISPSSVLDPIGAYASGSNNTNSIHSTDSGYETNTGTGIQYLATNISNSIKETILQFSSRIPFGNNDNETTGEDFRNTSNTEQVGESEKTVKPSFSFYINAGGIYPLYDPNRNVVWYPDDPYLVAFPNESNFVHHESVECPKQFYARAELLGNSTLMEMEGDDESYQVQRKSQAKNVTDTVAVNNTTTDEYDTLIDINLFCTERWYLNNSGRYEIPLGGKSVNSSYQVILYFSEIEFTNIGQRIFTILIGDNSTDNKQFVLDNFDILDSVAKQQQEQQLDRNSTLAPLDDTLLATKIVKVTANNIVVPTNSLLTIDLLPIKQNAKINAIEIHSME